ncbi:hypothetical protein [Gemmatimonas sp.]|uniref:type IV pilus modification PilV family protein n=1 Tax=Gemmatimonas sp. TaxID=1962908 RepID=UPI003983B2FB
MIGRTSRCTRSRTRSRTRARTRRGATLIELLIASVMLVVAIGGLLNTSAEIAEQMGGSRNQLIAAGVAQARLDSLASISCNALGAGSLASGTGVTRGIRESWTVTRTTYARQISLTLTLPRRSQTFRYSTLVPCA